MLPSTEYRIANCRRWRALGGERLARELRRGNLGILKGRFEEGVVEVGGRADP